MKKNFFLYFILLVSIVLFFISCKGVRYSMASDAANAVVISQAESLIEKSTDNYALHAGEVADIKARIDSIVIEEKKRSLNQATNAMWTVVQKDKFSLYGFFDLWKQQSTVSTAAVSELHQKMLSILNVIQTWEQRKKGGPLFNK